MISRSNIRSVAVESNSFVHYVIHVKSVNLWGKGRVVLFSFFLLCMLIVKTLINLPLRLQYFS